jgi:hypothetical protein
MLAVLWILQHRLRDAQDDIVGEHTALLQASVFSNDNALEWVASPAACNDSVGCYS